MRGGAEVSFHSFTVSNQAIVAPVWSLDIQIAQIWLPEFLNSINVGFTVSEAVYSANYGIYKDFPSPAVWAYIHLYGNPYFGLEL